MNLHPILSRSREIVRMQPRATVVSVLALGLGVFLASSALLTWSGLENLQQRMAEQMAVVGFLKEDLKEPDQDRILGIIESWPEVRAVTYLDSRETLSRFLAEFPEEEALLAQLDDSRSPLPAIVEVLPRSGADRRTLNDLTLRLSAFPEIEQIEAGEFWAQRMETLLSLVKAGGVLLVVSVAFAVIIIVLNTVRLLLSFYSREMDLLRLVGAGWSYAALPFVVSGGVIGLAGGLAGAAAMLAVALALRDLLHIQPIDLLAPSLSTAGCTAALAVLASLLAVARWRQAPPNGG